MQFLEEIKKICEATPEIKVLYLFGSQATGRTGPLSDYDFAIYLSEKSSSKRFDLKLKMIAELSRALKTDKIDLVVINDTESPELKYSIIQEGKVLYEEEPYKILIEPHILNEYFDFRTSLRRYGLTKA